EIGDDPEAQAVVVDAEPVGVGAAVDVIAPAADEGVVAAVAVEMVDFEPVVGQETEIGPEAGGKDDVVSGSAMHGVGAVAAENDIVAIAAVDGVVAAAAVEHVDLAETLDR